MLETTENYFTNEITANYVILGSNLATRVGLLEDTHLEKFFNRFAFRRDGRWIHDLCFIDGAIPLRVQYDDRWDICDSQMHSSEYYVIDESLVPEYLLQTRTEALKALREQHREATLDTSVYRALANGATVAKYRATLPTKDRTKLPDYCTEFRHVAKKRSEESDIDYELRLLRNFRLLIRDIKKSENVE
jgi:hypothetical protein